MADSCIKCVMDRSDPNIRFDETGVCNYCREEVELRKGLPRTWAEAEKTLNGVAERIRKAGKGKRYDCLVGISGGVDSSYIVHLCRRLELRPLLAHLDNGWNSEVSVTNIRKLVEKSGFDLYTHVVDWAEFRDLHRAFILASVIDIELPTDYGMTVAVYRMTQKHKIPFSIVGHNLATEYGMPSAWTWPKGDLTQIKAVHRRFGSVRLKTFPMMSLIEREMYLRFSYGNERIPILDLIPYKKFEAMETLKSEYGWEYYGGKHYESVFTRFYQAYILPEKFGVDKRKAHLSSLIRNGELTREDALKELSEPLYDAELFAQDKDFVLKKLGFSEQEFQTVMEQPPLSHWQYPTERRWIEKYRAAKRFLKGLTGHQQR